MKKIIILLLTTIYSSHAQDSTDYYLKMLETVEDSNKIKALEYLVNSYKTNNPQKCIECSEQMLKIAAKSTNPLYKFIGYLHLGECYRFRGDLATAFENYINIISNKDELKDEKEGRNLFAKAYNSMGIIYSYFGDYENALNYYFKSLELFVGANNIRGISYTYNNIGDIFGKIGDLQKSLEYYNKSLELKKKLNEKKSLSNSYNNIGTLFNEKGNYSEALEYYKKSLEISTSNQDLNQTAIVLNNIANLHLKSGDYQTGIKYAQDALDKFYYLKAKLGQAATLNTLGNLYLYGGKYEKAIDAFSKSQKVAIPEKMQEIVLDNYNRFYETYLKMNKLKEAITSLKSFINLKDTLVNKQKLQKIAEMQVKNDIDNKTREIRLLKKESELQSQIRNYLVILALLVLALAVILYFLLWIKRRSNRALNKKNIELEQVNTTEQEYLSIIEADLKQASDYVMSLMPKFMKTNTIETDWLFFPSTKLGGDTLGYHWIDRDNFAFYLFDVSGHGIKSALHAVTIMNVLQYQNLPGVDFRKPAEVLSALNRSFLMKEHDNMFFTAWYGVYNLSSKEIVYSGGGHPPAVVFRENDIKLLPSQNLPIGFMDNQEYTTGSFNLNQNRAAENSVTGIMLYSDGVYEIPVNGSMWSLSDFLGYIKKSRTDGNIAEIHDYLKKQQGKETFMDDFSMLKINFKPG